MIFAFLDEDENRAPVPAWSIGVVLESEELERGKLKSEELERGELEGGEPEREKLECGEPECGEPEREQPGQASGRRKDGTERE